MRHRLSAALLLALLALAGCADDPAPDVADPTGSRTPAPSTSAPASEPPSPSATPDPESADAFLRRWQQASDDMQLSGQTDSYLALGPKCEPCADTAAIVSRYYSAGGFIRFEGTVVRKVSRVGETSGIYEFDLVRSTPPTRFKESATAPVESFPGGESTFRMKLQRTPDGWVVLDYSQVAS